MIDHLLLLIIYILCSITTKNLLFLIHVHVHIYTHDTIKKKKRKLHT